MASLILRIGADYSALSRSLQQAENRVKRFGFKMERIGQDLTTRVSLPIIGIGAAAVQAFAQFDRIEKGLSALGGSAKAGGEQFQRLNKIVLDTRTTLDLKTAALGAQRLQGAGLSAAFAERTIKQLGIAATVSGSAIDDVGGVLRQFTQIIGKGKIEQEDLNSILDRMPALGALIKEEFGGVTAEAIRATGISMEEFVNRTVAAIESNKDFQNVQGGLAKSFESFANAVQVGIAPLGEAIAKSLNLEQNLQRLGDFITDVSRRFSELSPATQRFIVVSLAAAAAVGPLALGMGAAARALPLLRSGFTVLAGPLSLVGNLFVSATKGLAGYATLILRGGAVGRTIALTKAVSALRTAMAVLTGPVGLVVAAVALVAVSIKKAYDNSATFRNQLAKLGNTLQPIINAVTSLASKIADKLGVNLSSIGSIFNLVFGGIAAGISFQISVFQGFADSVGAVFTAIKQAANFDFAAAGETLKGSLFNPANLAEAAKTAAKDAIRVFNETVAGEPVDPLSVAAPSLPSSPVGSDGSEFEGTSKGSENVNKFFGAFANLNLEVERSKAVFDSFGGSLAELPVIGGITGVNNLNQALADYATGLEVIGEKQGVFGESYDGLTEKINLTKSAITGLLEEGFTAADPQVEGLIEKYGEFQTAAESMNATLEAQKTIMETLGSVTSKAFDGVGKALKNGESAFKAFGNAVLGAVREAIAAEIKLAVTTAATSALKTTPFPFNIALAAAAGAGASALFNGLLNTLKIPALAEGGIATGATLALIGEGSESEAILPLSKLQSLLDMSGGGGGGVMEFRIDGDDLYAVVEAAGNRKNRFA